MTAATMSATNEMPDAGAPAGERRAAPFLKWAGGKRRLVPRLLELAPTSFGTYYEPFLGGGALFFALRPERAVLSDANRRLMRTYAAVRDDVDRVVALLRRSPHTKEFFLRARRLRVDDADDVSAAAWLIYLNRTAFNGLYRVNARGEFNVPFGRYANPTICDEPGLGAASRALRRAELRCGDFAEAASQAVAGDLVYFDPPYAPASPTSSFTAYTPGGFTLNDHRRLRDLAAELKARDVHVMVSNSATPAVLEMYSAGFEVTRVSAGRAIAADGSRREKVTELIIT